MDYVGLRLDVKKIDDGYASTYAEEFGMFTSSRKDCREAIEESLELARDEFRYAGAPKAWLGKDKIKLTTDYPETDKEARQALRELDLTVA